MDFDNNVAGIERATRLILDICGGEAGPLSDVVANLPERPPVRMRVERARKVIGVAISAGEMGEIFDRLGLPSAREFGADGETFVVAPPSYSFDLAIQEDLIEEIARVYGFDRIPALPPVAPAVMRAQPESRRTVHEVRERMAGLGYHETINFSFVEASWEADLAGVTNPIRVLNPIASQLSVMRSTPFDSLTSTSVTLSLLKHSRYSSLNVGRLHITR